MLGRGLVAGLAAVGVLWLAQQAAAGANGRWYSIAPPLLAVCLAFATRRLLLALAIAVLVGGMLAVVAEQGLNGLESWLGGVQRAGGFVYAAAWDPDHAVILVSVFLMLGMITVAMAAGGFAGLVQALSRLARSRRATNGCTVLMGLVLFFDDYANSVLIGSTMRPLTDRQRISRAKLAFLIDATAAPVAGVAIVSTWIGYEVGLFREVGQQLHLGRDGFAMFLDALGFRFYCWLMLLFLIINVLCDRDFGPMAQVERAAACGYDPARPAVEPASTTVVGRHNPWTAVLPLGVFVGGILIGLWWDGGGLERLYHQGQYLWQISYWRDVLGSVTRSVQVIGLAAAVALIVGVASARGLGGMSGQALRRALSDGARLAVYPCLILVLAWSLQKSCAALGTGQFLAAAVQGNVTPVLFPTLLFTLAGLIAFATGTSWGTMAILIPTAIPVAYQLDQQNYGLITVMSLAAVLDGAIFGDHCSPISDTTILSATSSGCPLLQHVQTQLPYGLVVAGAAMLLGYLPAALWNWSWPVSVLAAALLFVILHYCWGKTPEPSSIRPPASPGTPLPQSMPPAHEAASSS
ncbi:MAG: hypothetical protein NZU63_00045 [Gemmataceae bacterium]|nr:hypothetical protein [Gemmataceae bacterium]MDW8241761.1 Na+/H+ antiporter NhaC family protein [Thermogemmata sp.]